jgi:hypothetical protein
LVQLGGALGLAFVSVVQTSLQTKALARGEDPVDALLKGLHGAFWFAAGSSFTALLIAAVVLRNMGSFSAKQPASDASESVSDASEGPSSVHENEKGQRGAQPGFGESKV